MVDSRGDARTWARVGGRKVQRVCRVQTGIVGIVLELHRSGRPIEVGQLLLENLMDCSQRYRAKVAPNMSQFGHGGILQLVCRPGREARVDKLCICVP
jgi:hypothetical protein